MTVCSLVRLFQGRIVYLYEKLSDEENFPRLMAQNLDVQCLLLFPHLLLVAHGSSGIGVHGVFSNALTPAVVQPVRFYHLQSGTSFSNSALPCIQRKNDFGSLAVWH